MRQDDQRLIRLLAATLTRRPRSNLTELAAGAGISRATLYRFAPTRAAIVEKVTAEAWVRLQAALPGGDASPDPMARLRRTTHALVEDLDLVIYIVNEMGMEGAERGNTYYAAPEWESFQAHLDAFSCTVSSAACSGSKCRLPGGATSTSRACSGPVGQWPPEGWRRRRWSAPS